MNWQCASIGLWNSSFLPLWNYQWYFQFSPRSYRIGRYKCLFLFCMRIDHRDGYILLFKQDLCVFHVCLVKQGRKLVSDPHVSWHLEEIFLPVQRDKNRHAGNVHQENNIKDFGVKLKSDRLNGCRYWQDFRNCH